MRLSAPSKTFLFGEYLALKSGPSILLSSGPRFEFEITQVSKTECKGLHPSSPAGRLMRDHSYKFQNISTNFFDPHNRQGGFGASGAQFIFTYVWSKICDGSLKNISTEISLKEMWQSYRNYAWTGEGIVPSGADIVSQFNGGITSFGIDPFGFEKLQWGFQDVSFFVVRTGHKVATHEHLNGLKQMPVLDLKPIAEACLSSFKQGDWGSFKQAINEYSKCLLKHNLTCDDSIELMHKLNQHQSVEAVRACGALGADTLLVFFNYSQRNRVRNLCQSLNLPIVAGSVDKKGLSLELEFIDKASFDKKLLLTPENIGDIHV